MRGVAVRMQRSGSIAGGIRPHAVGKYIRGCLTRWQHRNAQAQSTKSRQTESRRLTADRSQKHDAHSGGDACRLAPERDARLCVNAQGKLFLIAGAPGQSAWVVVRLWREASAEHETQRASEDQKSDGGHCRSLWRLGISRKSNHSR
jgi:hypothetical protein